ncbi:hypothetical protein [Marinobacter sp. ELB17]|uniref:hypothetical protein n=1 Tax=Marinobacter sp. ELB17 TaxID=270374 RepID=UPI00031269BB|nr:hypothetical protein [Marinobacter sp. ELB17]
MNAEALGIDLERITDKQRETLGIGLRVGSAFKVEATGEILSIFFDFTKLVGGRYFPISFDQIIPEFGATANDLVETGKLTEIDLSDYLDIPYPLKLSASPGAVYEDLPVSQIDYNH